MSRLKQPKPRKLGSTISGKARKQLCIAPRETSNVSFEIRIKKVLDEGQM
ncbi:4624_t:CDS:2, partial [Acaulospora morrowiae]